MLKLSGRDLLFGLCTLLVTAILVQAVYATLIRPRAEAILARAGVGIEERRGTQSAQRSVFVVIRHYEHEIAIILAAWALSLLAHQARKVTRSRRLLAKRYIVRDDERSVVRPEDALALGRAIEALPRPERDLFLPRMLVLALRRFAATRSVQAATETIRGECERELARLDSQLAMIRFTAWAIPAVGFAGTMRGIGAALREAHRVASGDLSGVTVGLCMTFNSTLTALALCVLVMFGLHQLQQAQDRLVVDTRLHVDRHLIRHMSAI